MKFGSCKLPSRFWAKVKPNPETGCWIWIGSRDAKGYGKFKINGKNERAHRVVKKFRRTAHHKCFETSCVNPKHLRDVSRSLNSKLGHRLK